MTNNRNKSRLIKKADKILSEVYSFTLKERKSPLTLSEITAEAKNLIRRDKMGCLCDNDLAIYCQMNPEDWAEIAKLEQK